MSMVNGRSLEEINEETTVLKLKNAILELHVCDTNERAFLNRATGTYDCVCQADRQCEQNMEDRTLDTALYAIIFLILVVWVLVKIWEVLQGKLPPVPTAR